MFSGRKNSSVILITLAEFAWLVVFGVLLLLKGKDEELTKANAERDKARQEVTNTMALSEKFGRLTNYTGRIEDELAKLRAVLTGLSLDEARRLLEQGKELPEKLAATEKRLTESEREAAAIREELNKLRREFDALPPDAAKIRDEYGKLKLALDAAVQEAMRLRDENSKLRASEAVRQNNEFSIRREITGLPDGPLRRVVILFDTSSSMTGSTAWEDARRLVRVWLTYLPIEECVLITFNSDTRLYPSSSFLRLRQTNGVPIVENQSKLLAEINDARLGTYTDTLKAFELAYGFKDANLILLFTDGKPKTRFESFDRLAPQIYSLVEKHPSVPILAVGLGDYEKLESDDKRAEINLQIQFLKRLAQLSKGSFMAR